MNTIRNVGRTLLVGVLSLALVGCVDNSGIENIAAQAPAKPKFIEGKPVSVAQTTGHGVGSFSAVVNVTEKEVLASTYSSFAAPYLSYTQADALIQAQIAKGSNGFVRLHGEYGQDGIFNVKSVEAGGYRVSF